MAAPTEYRAVEEYDKSERARAIPGNMPMRVMRTAMAKLIDPHLRAEIVGRNKSEIIKSWPRLEKGQKVEAISEMTSLEDVRELIYLDDDEDIQECLIARKRELKG